MDWQDTGVVLSSRRFGETGTIITLMTAAHGRHAGLMRGQRKAAAFQPGSLVAASWRARIADQLGTWTLESVGGVQGTATAAVLDDALRLGALTSACALVDAAAPERTPMPGVYEGLEVLLGLLPGPVWDAAYVQWEIGLLASLGFGLDLKRCAATGRNDQLAYVSPRSGRAVSLSAGEPYRDRMLPLPGFLIGTGSADPLAIADGLTLTGHFVERCLFAQGHGAPPASRDHFVTRYRRYAARSGDVSGESSGSVPS